MVKNIMPKPKRASLADKLSRKAIKLIGTPQSLIIHTILFITIPSLSFFGLDFRAVNLLLTTWLSMEAIYLAIFIQMTVNRQGESIEDIEEDIEDIQEDVEDLSEDVEDISEHHAENPHHGVLDETKIGKFVKKSIHNLRDRHIL